MLIEFRVTNFRSFREQQTFSMVADKFPEHMDSNTFDPDLVRFPRLLRSAVTYGANAAGKTNLLRAIQHMKLIVMHSAEKSVSDPIEFSPFIFAKSTRSAPSEFEMRYVVFASIGNSERHSSRGSVTMSPAKSTRSRSVILAKAGVGEQCEIATHGSARPTAPAVLLEWQGGAQSRSVTYS